MFGRIFRSFCLLHGQFLIQVRKWGRSLAFLLYFLSLFMSVMECSDPQCDCGYYSQYEHEDGKIVHVGGTDNEPAFYCLGLFPLAYGLFAFVFAIKETGSCACDDDQTAKNCDNYSTVDHVEALQLREFKSLF